MIERYARRTATASVRKRNRGYDHSRTGVTVEPPGRSPGPAVRHTHGQVLPWHSRAHLRADLRR
ncbi:hypothetical protein [Nocardia sp. NBC_01327]|uniref:hypothetical protein n=1 Tax=Nocardia sp. NBC_01327 TaxID=2903593 RepID=UPI002E108604|nr:hypothetical protein OG326_25820 [Nocardia sp. NBC_01327]